MPSVDEILTRGGQAVAVFREQTRGTSVPTDSVFESLIDRSAWGTGPINDATLRDTFFATGSKSFFPAFDDRLRSVEVFRTSFGTDNALRFVTGADSIVGGRLNILGLESVYIGTDVDWHLEPIAGKRSPLKHWKQFDELDSSETGNKKILWELNRHQHFFTLGVAYWLTEDERYARTFVHHLRSWIETNPPGMGVNWASSLEVSFRAMSWLWAFHFFRDSEHLVSGLLKKAVKLLYLHGRHIEKYLSSYYSPNTHLTGEALGLFYLGTQLPFLERAKHWRELGERILLDEITRQIRPDGVYFEQSTWYQRYTADIYSHFLLLRLRNGGRIVSSKGAALEERLEAAFELLMHFTLPNGRTPLIGDDDGGRLLPVTTSEPDDFRGTLAVGAYLFDRPDLKLASGPAAQEVFWLTGSKGLDHVRHLEKCEPEIASVSFPDGGYFVMRDGWSDTDNVLIVDCGEVGALTGAHGHSDALSIEVALQGKTLFVDSGTFTYHESPELRDYFRSSSAHNTLTVDGLSASEPGTAFSWRSRAEAKHIDWISRGRFDYFKGSHSGYERLADGVTHTRSILFVKGDYWIIRDHVTGKDQHDYVLNFHYGENIKAVVNVNGQFVEDENHRLFVFGDNGIWEHKESWISNNHAKRVSAPFVRFVSKSQGPQEFFSFILPTDFESNPPLVSEMQTVSGRAFAIKYASYTDLFVFNDDTTQSIDNGLFLSNFECSWARLRDTEPLPDEFILVNGDRFAMNGKEIFESHEVSSASARRMGNELYVETDLGRTVKKL